MTLGLDTAPVETVSLADLDRFEAGNHRLLCPFREGRRRSKSLGLAIEADGQAIWHCLHRPDHRWLEQVARAYLDAFSDLDLFVISGPAEMTNAGLAGAPRSQRGAQ